VGGRAAVGDRAAVGGRAATDGGTETGVTEEDLGGRRRLTLRFKRGILTASS